MLLKSEQIASIIEIIDYYTSFFIGKHIGVDVLSKKEKKILKKFGIDISIFTKDMPIIEAAFKFGMLAAALNKKEVKDMTFPELKKFLKSGKFIPLSPVENYALNFVKAQAYNDIRGLGNRISHDTLQVFIETSKTRRLKNQKIIAKETVRAIKDRLTLKELASNLGEKTKDWSRDFDRIADYVMHDAYHHGIAEQLLKEYGEDVEVFYTVYDRACEHCKEIYLKDQKTNEPKIFKLKDLIANGSNIGRKVKDWLASIDPIHPWCRCTMHVKPANSIWSVEKQQFILVRNDYGVKRKSKVIITRS